MPTLPAIDSVVGMSTDGLLEASASPAARAAALAQARRLGADLDLPLDPTEPIRVTPTGDLPALAGRPNVIAALRRRVLVAPGSLVHRPEYGGGLELELEQPGTLARRAAAANRIRRDLIRDPRVEDARVTVAQDLNRASSVVVDLAARLRGETAETTFSVDLVE